MDKHGGQIREGERATVRVPEAARILDISRAQAYELARRGELPGVIRLGRRYVVSRAILERTLNGESLEKAS
jgi:excisionase family DNA binding protein